MVVGAIIGAAVVGAGTAIYTSNQQMDAAQDQYENSNATMAAQAIAEGQSAIDTANAQADSITSQAAAEADAYRSQAQIEKDNIYAAAEEAREIAYGNIDKMQEEADESLRLLEGQQLTYEGKARAKAASSGVRREGSTELYLEGMETENDNQYNWLDKSYQSGLDVAGQTAVAEYNISRRQGAAAVEAAEIRAGAITSAAGSVAEATRLAGIYTNQALTSTANAYSAQSGGGGVAYGSSSSLVEKTGSWKSAGYIDK